MSLLLIVFGIATQLCIADRVVNITGGVETVAAGEIITFLCSGSTEMELGFNGDKYSKYQMVSLNVTITPDQNGMEATCSDRASYVTRKTELDVKFSPDLATNLTYDVTIGEQATVSITFKSNPIACYAQIQNKNGKDFQRFYLLNEGFKHTIILHFLKVEENDTGIYNLNLFQPSLSSSQCKYNSFYGDLLVSKCSTFKFLRRRFKIHRSKFTLVATSIKTQNSTNISILPLLIYILPSAMFVFFVITIISVTCFYRKKLAKAETKQQKNHNNVQTRPAPLDYISTQNLQGPTTCRRSVNVTASEDDSFDDNQYETCETMQPSVFNNETTRNHSIAVASENQGNKVLYENIKIHN